MTEKEKHDEWYTKKELYREICKMFNITPKLDVAATNAYHLCEFYFTKEDNALNHEWLIFETNKTGVWMNPPLLKGATKKFINKACQQWIKHNINIICLVPAGVISRKYFKPIWKLFKRGYFVDIEPIGRPQFLDHGKENGSQARNDYIVLVFKKRG